MRFVSGLAAVLLATLLTASFSGCKGEGRVSMGEETPATLRPTETVRPTETARPTDSFMEDMEDMLPSTNIGDREDGVIDG